MKSDIQRFLPPDSLWRDSILWYDTIDSTNTQAKSLAAAGAPHGTILLADMQTGGRGRLGRSFQSPAGKGLYLSVILRPQCPAAQCMHLTCAAAVAACQAVEMVSGLCPGIKWTNDLVIGKRKLGGILTELSVNPQSTLVEYAVIGIGLNCTQVQEDFSPELRDMAISLRAACSKAIDRNRLAAAMITALQHMDSVLFREKTEIMQFYRQHCVTLGQQISLLRGDSIRRGKAVDVDDEGGLTVLFEDGHLETVTSGEVSIRGMYGYV